VPIVPAAAIFDLAVGSASIRPDAAAGYQACQQATNGAVAQGTIGAGTGATVSKLAGPFSAKKGGLGSASTQLPDGTLVGAIVVVNAVGDIIDPQTQQVIGGKGTSAEGNLPPVNPFGNTTIAVIATNATLSKEQINKVAQMAHDGIAYVIRPAHTLFDGDTVFALSLGPRSQNGPDSVTTAFQVSMLGAAAATTLARAIVKAIWQATELHGVPAAYS
jgi:L-aminopeptidase/D-esterase-like protein